MKSTRNPFRINIGFLINQPIGYSRTIPYEIDQFVLDDDLAMENLKGTLDLVRTHDGFRGLGDFHGVFDNQCGRCLEPYKEHAHAEFEEFFTFPFADSSDEEIQVPEDGNVDFETIIHDYLLMELPIRPVCKEDCKGLCDVCGINLNTGTCSHDHEPTGGEEPANRLDLDSARKALKI